MQIRIEELEKKRMHCAVEDCAPEGECIFYSMRFDCLGTSNSYGSMAITEAQFNSLKVGALYDLTLKLKKVKG